MTEDFKKRQTRLREDFESITSSAEDFAGLNPMQRLYLLSVQQKRNCLSGEFKTTIAPDYQNMPTDDLGKIKSTFLENKENVVEIVDIETLDELSGFELYHTLKLDLRLRKCKHCGQFLSCAAG